MHTLRIYNAAGELLEILEFSYLGEAEAVANAFEELTTYGVERDYDNQESLG